MELHYLEMISERENEINNLRHHVRKQTAMIEDYQKTIRDLHFQLRFTEDQLKHALDKRYTAMVSEKPQSQNWVSFQDKHFREIRR